MLASIDLFPILPTWIIIPILGGLLALVVHGRAVLLARQVPLRWIRILTGLRTAAVVVFLLMLLQPVLSSSRTVEQQDLAVLIDTSASMDLPGGSGGGSRLDEVLPALQKGKLGAHLRNSYRRIHWFCFDGSARPLNKGDLASLRPRGLATHYARSLAAARKRLRGQGIAPKRLLLVSDGNDHGAADVVRTASRLGLVIDTLAPSPAPESPGPSAIAIAYIQYRPRVLLGSETRFDVTLRRSRAAEVDQPLTLRLAENGKDVRAEKVVFPKGRIEQTFTLLRRPPSVGTKQYGFRLSTTGPAQAEASVRVMGAKSELLILEDAWRWEVKYLRRVYEDDPRFHFTTLLTRGGGSFVQFGSPERRVNLIGFPQSREDLDGFDTIVLGDPNPRRWPRGLAAALAQQVAEESKSLVLIAGPNLARVAEVPELSNLLPVKITPESARPVEGTVEVRINPDGTRSPFFAHFASFGAAELPPLDRVYPAVCKRPAATVLLETSKLANASGNLVVIAEQPVGLGRVLYIGSDTLWKWQMLASASSAGATPYSLFWQQAFGALAPDRPNPGGVSLRLQPDRSHYEVEHPVKLRATIQPGRAFAQPRLKATVVLPDKKRMPLDFAIDPADPTLFRAEFEPALAGPHQILATLTSAGKTRAEGAAVIYVENPRERDDTRVNLANMTRIARDTGGQPIDPADPRTWPQPGEPIRQSVASAFDLWNKFTLLLLMCALLGADWLIRLRRGYM